MEEEGEAFSKDVDDKPWTMKEEINVEVVNLSQQDSLTTLTQRTTAVSSMYRGEKGSYHRKHDNPRKFCTTDWHHIICLSKISALARTKLRLRRSHDSIS